MHVQESDVDDDDDPVALLNTICGSAADADDQNDARFNRLALNVTGRTEPSNAQQRHHNCIFLVHRADTTGRTPDVLCTSQIPRARYVFRGVCMHALVKMQKLGIMQILLLFLNTTSCLTSAGRWTMDGALQPRGRSIQYRVHSTQYMHLQKRTANSKHRQEEYFWH